MPLLDEYAPNWTTFLETQLHRDQSDPLRKWKQAFATWRGKVSEFHQFEVESEFEHSDALLRIHRGLLCDIISNGELLAVSLLNDFRSSQESATHLVALDEFILELRITLDTWHSVAKKSVLSSQLKELAA